MSRRPSNRVELKKLETQLNALAQKIAELKQKQLIRKPEQGKWWIGDETSTDELIAKVHEVISNRPRTLQELHEVIGASRARVSGAIVRLQVNGYPVQNLGTKYRALWWLPSAKR
jgi:biotin operon repressor